MVRLIRADGAWVSAPDRIEPATSALPLAAERASAESVPAPLELLAA
jgi:hypothetical protein